LSRDKYGKPYRSKDRLLQRETFVAKTLEKDRNEVLVSYSKTNFLHEP